MTNSAAALLASVDGERVSLRGVTASGQLTGLLFELTVEQTYENAGATNIEAVYTFPVPHHAVLLGLDLEIGDRKLSGVAVRRQVASERYEDAVEKGDSAALLEQAGDGLYTLSLGNLLAGERAVIRYRYAELLDRHEDWVRLAIPTVIAPRYGDPAGHGVQAHQVPGVNLLASYPFALIVDVIGAQAGATLSSPSHRILVSDIEGGQRVTLGAGAELDRDFVLQLSGAVTASASITTRSGNGWVSLVSLAPQLDEAPLRGLNLKLVVDCSGSMGGDSIAQARRALLSVLGRLSPADHVSLTRFGSSFEHLTKGLTTATAAAIAQLSHAVREMDADLGGTELAGALQAAIEIPPAKGGITKRGFLGFGKHVGADPGPTRDLLLITDGEVWAVEQVVDHAARSGHRLFVVAVGAAPAEGLARQLSEKTGGACEFVSPNEDIEGAIVRMFQRMRQLPRQISDLSWPVAPEWQAPLPVMVFAGDTLHLLAGFSAPPVGEVVVTISGGESPLLVQRVAVATATDAELLPRVAAARRLSALPEEEAAALAEAHQLVSKHTSFVVVQVRADGEKALALPELRKVEQMLAAGWGATAFGALAARDMCVPAPTMRRWGMVMGTGARSGVGHYDAPSPMARPEYYGSYGSHLPSIDRMPESSPAEVVQALAALGDELPTTFGELALLGVPVALLGQLYAPVDNEAHDEETIVKVLIALLARSPAGEGLSEDVRSRLAGDVFGNRELRTLRAAMQRLLGNVTASDWPQHTTAEEVQGGRI